LVRKPRQRGRTRAGCQTRRTEGRKKKPDILNPNCNCRHGPRKTAHSRGFSSDIASQGFFKTMGGKERPASGLGPAMECAAGAKGCKATILFKKAVLDQLVTLSNQRIDEFRQKPSKWPDGGVWTAAKIRGEPRDVGARRHMKSTSTIWAGQDLPPRKEDRKFALAQADCGDRQPDPGGTSMTGIGFRVS